MEMSINGDRRSMDTMILIECGLMINGESSAPIHNAAVLVDGERIVYAGPADQLEAPTGAEVLRRPDATVMPGLIDVHVHLMNDGGPGLAQTVLGDSLTAPAELALKGFANARKSLDAGYTTLRNLHAPGYVDVALRDAIASGRLEGPRLVVSGQGLCITGGHMDQSVLPDHVRVEGRVGVCDTPEEFRQAVRQHVKVGVDCIKINSDVGAIVDAATLWRQEMSFDEMAAACQEAHKFGRHVAAHTAGGPPVENAVRAGVDTVEHGHWLTDRAIDLMRERGAYYVPTLIVNTRNFAYDREELGVSEPMWRWLQLAYEAKWDSLRRAHAAGVKIAAGSDAGFLVDHGENAAELEELVKGGLSTMEAIQAATRTAAELLGQQAEIGVLAPGKVADIIVVDGDPLRDIRLLQASDRIAYVLKKGRVVKSPYLASLQPEVTAIKRTTSAFGSATPL
jgi:imidazolonepropionase-like amidohydrolase